MASSTPALLSPRCGPGEGTQTSYMHNGDRGASLQTPQASKVTVWMGIARHLDENLQLHSSVTKQLREIYLQYLYLFETFARQKASFNLAMARNQQKVWEDVLEQALNDADNTNKNQNFSQTAQTSAMQRQEEIHLESFPAGTHSMHYPAQGSQAQAQHLKPRAVDPSNLDPLVSHYDQSMGIMPASGVQQRQAGIGLGGGRECMQQGNVGTGGGGMGNSVLQGTSYQGNLVSLGGLEGMGAEVAASRAGSVGQGTCYQGI
eukprot:749421-Hanusia_phi.AAC.1